ncbi:MAG: alanine racemase [Clostridiales bacterium]|nr:alanine racemase [Clostridiales bacterium]
MQKVVAKIHLGNIRRNAETFRRLTKTGLCAVVKANAYGHGAEEVVNALSGVADSFAVAIVDEGIRIRGVACGKEILVLTPPITAEDVLRGAWNGFSLTVSDLITAKLIDGISRARRLPINVHLKVNTGMNRYGMEPSALGKVCKRLQTNPFVRVAGVYSHLYATSVETSRAQRTAFERAVTICKRYFPLIKAHLSATYGALLGKEFAFDSVRIGLGLYGYLPVDKDSGLVMPDLEKGMTVYATAVTSRKYLYGGAGYGENSFAKSPKDLTVCRYGYADGFLRRRENGLLDAETQANNLCMDACIKIGRLPRGKQFPIMTDAAAVARATDTIPYEVLCAATRRAERIYDNE